jgi:hypothetical protein
MDAVDEVVLRPIRIPGGITIRVYTRLAYDANRDALFVSIGTWTDFRRLSKLLACFKTNELLIDNFNDCAGYSALVVAALQNPHITVLHVGGHFDWDDDALTSEALAKNTTLKAFTIDQCNIADLGSIGRALAVNRTLETFCLSDVKIEDPAPLLAFSTTLKCVNLMDIELTDSAHLMTLRAAYDAFPVIKYLTASVKKDKQILETEALWRD